MRRYGSRLFNVRGHLACCCALAALATGCGGRAESEDRGASPGSGVNPTTPGSQPRSPQRPPSNQPIPTVPLPETCDDNPLLAGCAVAPEVPPPLPERPQDNPLLSALARVEATLDYHCGSCHGSEARRACNPAACDGFFYVDQLSLLIQNGQVVACNWMDSPVGQRILSGDMPPAGSGIAPMSTVDRNIVRRYVNGICNSLTAGGDTDSERLEVERILGESCSDCHGALAADAGSAPGGLANIQDISGLIAGGFLLPCNSRASPIWQVLRNASMHPAENQMAPLNGDDVVAIANFIDRPCLR